MELYFLTKGHHYMKKILNIFILIFFTVHLSSCSNNPYAGVYFCKRNTNIVLKLKDDNSFILVDNLDKDSECFVGNYSIKDNIISLKFNDKNSAKIFSGILKGKFKGSVICFDKSTNIFQRTW